MANRTDTQADTVHGTNPQYLVDRIIRSKIYNDAYWKEFCFGLTTESVIDRAVEIDYVGGTYGGRRRPCKFLCLFLKLLQIQPDDDVILEYMKQADYKYLRALGCAYFRITARHVDVYRTLEPFYGDYRKLRYRDMTGKMSLIHMDEFIDWLIRDETVCDITMPQIPKREVLEIQELIEPRQSGLEDDLDELDDLEEDAAVDAPKEEDEEKKADDGSAPANESVAEKPDAKLDEPDGPDWGDDKSPRRSRSPRSGARKSPVRKSRSVSAQRRRDRDRRASPPKRSSPPKRGASRDRRGRSASSSPDRNRKDLRMKFKGEDPNEKKKKEKKDKKDKEDKGGEKKEKKEKKEKGGEKAESKGPRKEKDGLSVEGWDQVRADLGLKPLKK